MINDKSIQWDWRLWNPGFKKLKNALFDVRKTFKVFNRELNNPRIFQIFFYVTFTKKLRLDSMSFVAATGS